MNTVSLEAKKQFVSTAEYLERRGLFRGRAEGMEKGMEKGRAENAQFIAGSMLREGFDDSLILKLTQVSKAQLQALKSQLKSS